MSSTRPTRSVRNVGVPAAFRTSSCRPALVVQYASRPRCRTPPRWRWSRWASLDEVTVSIVLSAGGPGRCGQPLRLAHVGDAVRPHVAVRPRLRGGPPDRVVPVLRLVDVRVEGPFAGPPAAHVLQDHGVAGGGHLGGVQRAAPRERVERLVVRRALDQHGMRRVVVRPVHVGPQQGAVTHRHVNVPLRQHAHRHGPPPRRGTVGTPSRSVHRGCRSGPGCTRQGAPLCVPARVPRLAHRCEGTRCR